MEYYKEAHEIIAGGFGGALGIVAGGPFDLVKIRLQTGDPTVKPISPFQCAKLILRNEGFFAFWKGIVPPVVANVPINAIGFATYGNAQRFLTKTFEGENSECSKNIVPTTPLQYQIDFYKNELFSRYTLPQSFVNQFGVKNLNNSTYQISEQSISTLQSNYTTSSTLASSTTPPNWWALFLGACWSGFLSCIISTPSELLKIQEQTYFGKPPSTYQVARDIMVKDGPLALFRGFWATVLRDSPSVGVYFGSYEYCKWLLRRETWSPQVTVNGEAISPEESQQRFGNQVHTNRGDTIRVNWQHNITYDFYVPLIAGAIAGPLSWISTYPIDVVKSRLQAMSSVEAKKTGIIKIFNQILKEKGWKFFTVGLGTTIVRAMPVNASTFYFYEKTLEFLQSNRILMPNQKSSINI
jgi:solute carrier family 25 carnitine/acylcarnitine transporter 20/29